MKILNCFLTLFVIGVLITSCQKDETLIGANEIQQPSSQVELRSYNQIDCGFADNFCEREPKYPPVVALVSGGEGGIKLSVKNSQYRIYPFEIFDGSTGIIVNDGSQSYIGHRSENSFLLSKAMGINLPTQFGRFLELNYQDNFDISNVSTKIEENIGLSNVGTTENPEYVLTDDIIGTDITWVKECDYILVSKVENFVSVFFDASTDQSHIEDFIEEAFNSCPSAYPDYQANIPSRCLNYCIDPRCVVDYLLNINAGLSDYQKRVLVSRCLEETLGLTNDEQNWLTFNDQSDLVYEIYEGLLTNHNLGRCDKEDCGMAGGYHELIKQEMAGETLTVDETEGLLEFFSVMSCDDPVIYSCFREAQQNPESDIAEFLNDIKQNIVTQDNPLLDGCDDLSNYSDAWFELAELNPNTIPAIKSKLEQLGEDYWIQTLENAQPQDVGTSFGMEPYFKWWLYAPSVNMDFFGITIQELPNNPNTGIQFTPAEFINYIQLNFASSEFMGDGNECGPSFDFINSSEETNWSDGDATTSVLTISMPDDGNVIASQHLPGEYWTFSTLNAPGWLEGDSWDGYHPVSGNRRFGLIQNSDGTFTFYTTGVDRLTGWWHAIVNPLVGAFEEADELWACVMGLIADFVNEYGGMASNDYDCVTVRPKWTELRNAISQGCEGFTTSLDDFPCEEAEPCQ